MPKNIELKHNFSTVFAKYDTIDDIKAVANAICAEVKSAYEVRVAEIKSGKSPVVVEAEPVSPATPTKSKKSKAAAAKEAAAKFKEQEAAKTSKSEAVDSETEISITDTEAIKKLGLTFTKYNDKCWVLRGETKPLRKILKEQFKGVFNSRLSGGEGWVFRTANVEECAKALGLKVKAA